MQQQAAPSSVNDGAAAAEASLAGFAAALPIPELPSPTLPPQLRLSSPMYAQHPHFSAMPGGLADASAQLHSSASRRIGTLPPHHPMHPLADAPHSAPPPARTSSRVPASQRRTPSTPADKLCNCRNSKCLKLYCECFASGRYCAGCNCLNCLNNKENEAQRAKAIETVLERNPNAFRPKIQFQQGEDGGAVSAVTRHTKGCSCRKSNCLKKYCECFQAGIFCAVTCRCKECKNFEGSEHLMAVMEHSEPFHTSQAAALRRSPAPVQKASQSMQPELKRHRTTAARSSQAAGGRGGGTHYVPAKHDPARDAIRGTRDKRMQEVVGNLLVKFHMEALQGEEENTRESAVAENAGTSEASHPEEPAPAGSRDWTPKHQAPLSPYYVATEGLLLSEFGNFLGKMCDRIEQQVQKTAEDG